ncbi:hypothetical protein [Brevibacillus laterosporus]|uniref:hypothetical protein n=1 Tax=Brevibacillus laterosporus TaxID=1465 RepID=UPI000CE32251|nr:hypothetical protein [Brevibacillus laterosporus]MED1665061.1 hypothetical protein [Brevibacillus laterosporus]MED1668728.1 hypothetical protein [Brevibacillus laterosporus]MED1716395.1 hypothetical protein [Brevibacillus laterosporus]PPA88555.1 hypothetical protein C4A76_07920 [Brevibacillus laterosporus]
MLTDHLLEGQANALESAFYSAEVELDDKIVPVSLLRIRQSVNKVTFLIHLSASMTGIVTKCIVKDVNGQVVWEDRLQMEKPNREITLSIPIELQWKAGE